MRVVDRNDTMVLLARTTFDDVHLALQRLDRPNLPLDRLRLVVPTDHRGALPGHQRVTRVRQAQVGDTARTRPHLGRALSTDVALGDAAQAESDGWKQHEAQRDHAESEDRNRPDPGLTVGL